MIADIKQALYMAETARRNGPDGLTKEQLCEALVALAEDREQLEDQLNEVSDELDDMEAY